MLLKALLAQGFLFLSLSCATHNKPDIYSGNEKIFGTFIEWEAADLKTNSKIKEKLAAVKSDDAKNFDPDCMYRPLEGGQCSSVPNPERLAKIEKLSSEIQKESLGHFNIVAAKKTKLYRDFGGIYQGFIVDELNDYGPSYLNFSGDIYLDRSIRPSKDLWITHPSIQDLDYIKVDMSSGWILSASSPKLVAEMRSGKTKKTLKNSDFQKIVLFAKPEFSGARLDAWATALISGGKKLLNHLWQLDLYQGQWAYMYFEDPSSMRCSPNINCNLTELSSANKIKIQW